MLIGIDVGTTAVKAALFDSKGHVLKAFGERYPTSRPQPGHVEQSPNDWMTRMLAALSQFEHDDVAAIGLCSQVNTHVFVDDRGNALLPAITWQDGRCAEDAARLDAQVQHRRQNPLVGCTTPN